MYIYIHIQYIYICMKICSIYTLARRTSSGVVSPLDTAPASDPINVYFNFGAKCRTTRLKSLILFVLTLKVLMYTLRARMNTRRAVFFHFRSRVYFADMCFNSSYTTKRIQLEGILRRSVAQYLNDKHV